MTERIAGLVLAGGSARRMGGGDKPLLDVGGRTMLAAVISALELTDIAISANGDPARFAPFGWPVLPDGPFIDQGPLAGVLAGLEWAAGLGASALLTAPGDTPFLPRGLADHLGSAPAGVCYKGRLHHLVAIWPVLCVDQLRRWLASPGSRRVRDFAEHIGMRYVDFGAWDFDPFMNINTPEQLSWARCMNTRLFGSTI